MKDGLIAVLIAPRDWTFYDAFVAAFGLCPAQDVYEFPQHADGAKELTYEALLALLRASPEENYDIYMGAPGVSGLVVGVRPNGLLFGLPSQLGLGQIEAFAGAEGIVEGYLWSDEPLPETVTDARRLRRVSLLGTLEAGRFTLGPDYDLIDG